MSHIENDVPMQFEPRPIQFDMAKIVVQGVRGNCCEFWVDLEMLDIVEFLLILISRGPRDFISSECNFF